MSLFHDAARGAGAITLEPVQAFVLHHFEGAGTSGTAITQHPATHAKSRSPAQCALQLGDGRLLDAAAVAEVLARFVAEPDGWLPPRVFYKTRSCFAWRVPAKVRRMAFQVEKQRCVLTVPWPQLLMAARSDGSLQVLALPAKAEPARNVRPCHAPLMNLSSRGTLCFGTATRPPFSLDSMAAYEEAVFLSRFTHVNHPATLAIGGATAITNEMHLKTWRSLVGQPAFPDALLRPMAGTLGTVLGARDE